MPRKKPGKKTVEKVTKVTHKKKAALLIVFKKSWGSVSRTCEKVGISRKTFYEWCKKDPAFREAIDEIQESMIDFSESKLLLAINNNNITAIIFHLKTKGKSRGYVERQEITGRDGKPIAEPSEKQIRNAAENALKALDARKRLKDKQ